MVKKKEDDNNWLRKEMAHFEQKRKDSPIVASKYYVVEITPARRYHDGYDMTWSRESVLKVSPDFKTLEEAKDWVDQHEPDEGKTLETRVEHLREITERRWVSW